MRSSIYLAQGDHGGSRISRVPRPTQGGPLDRTSGEPESAPSMRTEPSARSAPARTISERLHALLCHAGAVSDGQPLAEVGAHALEALDEVLEADRGAVALLGAGGLLRVAG